ncbi:hypothetical protein CALCODRAFT_110782 [Calocera cornea HHB12733]|uniref:Uncharacterized protein n=1 Tax=Calocera cornea HHB12733 TaxID=1353952 RepID=A0A165D2A2_9BASI|nr:hypothetical protein CALCODRAFT_110782 [Calocera cornea HHB12733]
MHTSNPIILKGSASLLTLTKPKSEEYTCYFSECWAPSCPTHGVAHQHAIGVLPTPTLLSQSEVAWIGQLHSCGDSYEHPTTAPCLTPPGARPTRAVTAPDGGFRCYAPTCEAINCPRHKHIVFPQSPPHQSVAILHKLHHALFIPVPGPYDCPDLAYGCSPSSTSSTNSYLRTPTGMESTGTFFPPPTTVITPDSEDDYASSRSSVDSFSTFPCPPSIVVEPPSARSSMQSAWSVRGNDTDGYDGSSEMEGIPRRREAREMLGPPRPANRRKGAAAHRSKGKENARSEKTLKRKPAVTGLMERGRVMRAMMI